MYYIDNSKSFLHCVSAPLTFLLLTSHYCLYERNSPILIFYFSFRNICIIMTPNKIIFCYSLFFVLVLTALYCICVGREIEGCLCEFQVPYSQLFLEKIASQVLTQDKQKNPQTFPVLIFYLYC